MDRTPPPDSPTVTLEFFAQVRALLARQDPSLHFLGMTGTGAQPLDELTARARSSVWNMQRLLTFHVVRANKQLTDDQRRRGVPIRAVVGPAAVVFNPTLSSYTPDLRLGPVFAPLMVIDRQHVVVPGTDGDSIWTSTEPGLVARGIEAYEAVWDVSQPAVADGDDPPLTPRMVSIAFLLADGASDRQISRELGVSERTVSNEVREIGRRLGTANRSHTIARICGAPL